mmetsp:Transcript_55896/g.137314  ORF Transcript_55896/g.137314 Transcript_55896/m.137314 type:complete len:242 (+) Transcript_55896:206-931(+)
MTNSCTSFADAAVHRHLVYGDTLATTVSRHSYSVSRRAWPSVMSLANTSTSRSACECVANAGSAANGAAPSPPSGALMATPNARSPLSSSTTNAPRCTMPSCVSSCRPSSMSCSTGRATRSASRRSTTCASSVALCCSTSHSSMSSSWWHCARLAEFGSSVRGAATAFSSSATMPSNSASKSPLGARSAATYFTNTFGGGAVGCTRVGSRRYSSSTTSTCSAAYVTSSRGSPSSMWLYGTP